MNLQANDEEIHGGFRTQEQEMERLIRHCVQMTLEADGYAAYEAGEKTLVELQQHIQAVSVTLGIPPHSIPEGEVPPETTRQIEQVDGMLRVAPVRRPKRKKSRLVPSTEDELVDEFDRYTLGKPKKNAPFATFLDNITKAVYFLIAPEHFLTSGEYVAAVRRSFCPAPYLCATVNPTEPKVLAFTTEVSTCAGKRQVPHKSRVVQLTLESSIVTDPRGGTAVSVSLLSNSSVCVYACELFRAKMTLGNAPLIEFAGTSAGNKLAVFQVSTPDDSTYYETDAQDIVRPVVVESLGVNDALRVLYRDCRLQVAAFPDTTDLHLHTRLEKAVEDYQRSGVFPIEPQILRAAKNDPVFSATALKGLPLPPDQEDELTTAEPLVLGWWLYYDAQFRMLVSQSMRDLKNKDIHNNHLPEYEHHMSTRAGYPLTYLGNAYYSRLGAIVPVFVLQEDITVHYAYNDYTQAFTRVTVSRDTSTERGYPGLMERIRNPQLLPLNTATEVKLTKNKITFALVVQGDDPALRPSVVMGLRRYTGTGPMLVHYYNQFLGTDFNDYHGNTKAGQFIFEKHTIRHRSNESYLYENGTYVRVTYKDDSDGYSSFF